MFSNLPGSSSIAENLPSLFPGYHTLKRCFEKLQEIQELLNGLSEHRRRKILTNSQAGKCLPLESLEMELDRLGDDYRDLCRLYEHSSVLQRSFLGRQLQSDADSLEHRIREFYKDTWKTTVLGTRWMSWQDKLRENPL